MAFGRKTTFWFVLAIFFVYCLSDHLVLAKKDTQDPTSSPTESPSVFPSSSPTISTSPSSLPSTFPSFFPTNNPTTSSSMAHTTSPTEMPTKTYTNSPSKASAYIPLKTSPETTSMIGRTVQFDGNQNDNNIKIDNGALRQTQSPTNEGGDMYSVLPIITFDVILSEEGVTIEKIQSFFVDFLDGVLEEISVTYGFDYSHLDSNGIISTFNQPQPFDTEYRIRMDGLVYYFDESPIRDSLAQRLNMYFSFWGASDLQNFLVSVGLEKAVVVSISIGGENFAFVSNEIEDGSQRAQNNDHAIRNIFNQDENKLSKATVVMLYTGLVLITVIIALLLFRHRIGLRRLHRDKEINSRRSRSVITVSNDGDKENRVRSNIPKSTARKQKDMVSSVSSWGTNKLEKRPMRISKKDPTESERGDGTFESISNAKLTKSKSFRGSEKKFDDSKILKEKKYSGSKEPGDVDKKECDLRTGKLKFAPIKKGLERRKSEDVGSDMETCVLANKNSSQIQSLKEPGQCRQQLSIRTDDAAPNLRLGEF